MGKITDNIMKEYASIVEFDTSVNSINEQKELRFTKDEFLKFKERKHIDDIKFFKYIFDLNYLKENVSEIKKELHISGKIIQWGIPVQTFIVYGYNTSLLYLETNEFKLEKGRMFEKNDEAVIYKNRLYPGLENKYWNDLDLNDKIVIKNDDGIYKEFTVVGITEQDPTDTKNTYRYMIYTTLESAEYFDVIARETKTSYISFEIDMNNINIINSNDFINLGYKTLIYLDSPNNFIILRNELYNEGVRIHLFFPAADDLISLTETMRKWSIIFIGFAGFVSLCAKIIFTNILFNTRKYEIAVLRSIGMKKSRLLLNYLIENLAYIWSITFVSLIVAQFISPIFTSRIFKNMQDLVLAETFDTLTTGANLELVLQNTSIVFGWTTVIVILTLILTCINIIRFEPLKIFNKQY